MTHANVIATIGGIRRYGLGILNRHPIPGEDGEPCTVVTADRQHHTVPQALIEVLAQTVPIQPVRPTLVYRVHQPYLIDRPWAPGSSDFTQYEIQPGDYPVTWVNRHGNLLIEVPANQNPQYGLIICAAVAVYSRWTNRVYSEWTSHDERPMTPATVTMTPYAYQVQPGGDSTAEYVLVNPAKGEVFPPVIKQGATA